HKVARSYVIYRNERARERETQQQREPERPDLLVTMEDGTQKPLDTHRLRTIVREACEGLEGVDNEKLFQEALKNLYSGVNIKDVRVSVVMTARAHVESEPNYSYVAARLLMDSLRSEALSF